MNNPPTMPLFSLLCQEHDLLDLAAGYGDEPSPAEPYSDDFISSLVSNEQKSFPNLNPTYLRSARAEALAWLGAASARIGFGASTVLLAANYLDRCFLSATCLLLQDDKPWMKQLSAVACLSLAAKFEETRVPLLVDLQVDPSADVVAGFVFEPKTVKRMELLVLSTLGWKMNPVTALSFVHCIVSRLDLGAEILGQCECILLSLVTNWRWVKYVPSVWALAALMQANAVEFEELKQLMPMLEINKEEVEECRGLIVEVMGNGDHKRKRWYDAPPQSPNAVISSCFSCESASSSVSSSPEPPRPKRGHFE